MRLISLVVLATTGAAIAEVTGPYVPTTATRENIFAGLTSEERETVSEFLQKQANVTM
jgi:DNA-binding MarR family transcriptional regulator